MSKSTRRIILIVSLLGLGAAVFRDIAGAGR